MSIRTYKHQDGTTSHQVRVYAEGRNRYVGTFPTEKAARIAEADALRGRVRTGRETLSTFRETWLDASHVVDTTRSGYRVSIRRAQYYIGDLPLDAIDTATMDELVGLMVKDDLSPRSVRHTVQHLTAMLKYAQRCGLVVDVPKPHSLPKIREAPIMPLTDAQVERLLDAAPEEWRSLFVLAVDTGLRRGELLGLRYDDIADGAVTVRRSVHGIRKSVGHPKSDAAYRTVPLTARAQEAVGEGEGWLFGIDGTYRNPDAVSRRVIAPTFRAAGIPGGIHMLRHTFASRLIQSGANIKVVQYLMGHESASLVISRYAHLFPTDARSAIERLNNPT